MLATRYSTLSQKVLTLSSRTVSSERKLLLTEEEHQKIMKEKNMKLIHSEQNKILLDKKILELNMTKNEIKQLKKEYGAQLFILNQKSSEMKLLQKNLINENHKVEDLQKEIIIHNNEQKRLAYKIETMEKMNDTTNIEKNNVEKEMNVLLQKKNKMTHLCDTANNNVLRLTQDVSRLQVNTQVFKANEPVQIRYLFK